MNRTTKVYAENRFAYDGVAFYLMETGENGVRAIASSITMTQHTGEMIPEQSFSLSREATQELMDNLWNCGFRPTLGMGSAGSLEATQDHVKTLKDVSNRLLSLIEKGKHD